MKRIERLRFLRTKAYNDMQKLSAIEDPKNANRRDLTKEEQEEFSNLKAHVDELDTEIAELSREPLAPAKPAATETQNVDADKLRAEGAESERKRIEDIRNCVKTAKLSNALAEQWIKEGLSIDQVRAKAFEEMNKPAPEQEGLNRPSGAGVGQESRDKARKGLTAALLHRIDPRGKELPGGERNEYSGLTLLDMARESLSVVGVKTRGMSRDDVATAALKGMNGGAEFFAGMMTGSDFTSILADVANKRMRIAYSAMPRTYEPFTRRVTVTDFKNINAMQISDLTTMKAVGDHGEIESATLTDSKETYAIGTFAEIVRLTRRTIINDDLRALDRIPQAIGQAAARLENETVWALITANAAMGDSVALFHATHKNLNTSNTLALAGLGTAKTALRKQTQPNGQAMNLTPKFLIVPAALETTALQLLNPQQVFASDSTKNVPLALVNGLTPIVEPLLDAASATVWYLACDPAQIDTIEVAYLEGQDGVYIETRNGFEIDGVEIKGRLDFGAGVVEFRGLQKNA